MASFKKHGTGWRAFVARNGVRKSKVFPTKIEAKDWAARQEHLILNAEAVASSQPFGDVLDRYAREVSVKKRGARWEILRIERFRQDAFAKTPIGDLRAADFAAWRDARLREVAPGTVRREMVLLSSAMNIARKEWGLISVNPMTDVKKPVEPPPRDRRVTDAEIEQLLFVAGSDLTTARARACHAFRFAIETGMRAGEIVGLRPTDIGGSVARLRKTKTGAPRSVPLSKAALALLEELPASDPLFGLTSDQLDAAWRAIMKRAAVDGLTFHDSRHEAVSRLARKLDVLALARMIGHRDIRQLQVYFNESAEDIAQRLDD